MLGDHVVDVTLHVEGGLWLVVVLAVEDLVERRDGVLERDELARHTRENLGNLKAQQWFQTVRGRSEDDAAR